MTDLSRFFDAPTGATIIVVGDVMLDCYQQGEIERISPEAPVPVLRHTRETSVLGGAANVAANLAGLGAKPILIGRVGDDPAGETVGALCIEAGIQPQLVVDRAIPTTRKTRFVSGGQQVLRLDQEVATPCGDETGQAIAEAAERALKGAGALVLSDYAKGLLVGDLAARLIALAKRHDIPVIVDPKGRDFSRYRGATAVTPNRRELGQAIGEPLSSEDDIVAAARAIMAEHDISSMLVTRSEDGLSWITSAEALHSPAEAREVFDVSGAGDTVVAVFARALSLGQGPAEAARLANLAAGIVVGKRGTAVVTAGELRETLRQSGALAGRLRSPISLDEARSAVAAWRREGLKVGFTNGCFDILHLGHASILERARARCDRLVVGLNSDASVTRLKGPGRPVNPESDRAGLLLALRSVDSVVVFEDDTPLSLIEALLPDVLVKGADYTVEEVVGADIVIAHGGEVALLDLEEGRSTTAIIERSKSRAT